MRMIISSHAHDNSPKRRFSTHWEPSALVRKPRAKALLWSERERSADRMKGWGRLNSLGVLEGLGFAKLHLPVRAENVKSCV